MKIKDKIAKLIYALDLLTIALLMNAIKNFIKIRVKVMMKIWQYLRVERQKRKILARRRRILTQQKRIPFLRKRMKTIAVLLDAKLIKDLIKSHNNVIMMIFKLILGRDKMMECHNLLVL